ncbi:hypothetical protein B0T17DRAFT_384665 [Bombardia bombarda]|uniref:Uncharacterized protein n=1 Tax=Bombardia bombarda TaxID=252184 RepID=A0AA39WAX0_9PEZI|nr:hypothetical protein B0T17DRAFT_384665 [Bombardia bombarda]
MPPKLVQFHLPPSENPDNGELRQPVEDDVPGQNLTSRKRGRPRKSDIRDDNDASISEHPNDSDMVDEIDKNSAPRKRGRPRKSDIKDNDASTSQPLDAAKVMNKIVETPTLRKRGRPRRSDIKDSDTSASRRPDATKEIVDKVDRSPSLRKRGRPRKSDVGDDNLSISQLPNTTKVADKAVQKLTSRKRGRPRKSDLKTAETVSHSLNTKEVGDIDSPQPYKNNNLVNLVSTYMIKFPENEDGGKGPETPTAMLRITLAGADVDDEDMLSAVFNFNFVQGTMRLAASKQRLEKFIADQQREEVRDRSELVELDDIQKSDDTVPTGELDESEPSGNDDSGDIELGSFSNLYVHTPNGGADDDDLGQPTIHMVHRGRNMTTGKIYHEPQWGTLKVHDNTFNRFSAVADFGEHVRDISFEGFRLSPYLDIPVRWSKFSRTKFEKNSEVVDEDEDEDNGFSSPRPSESPAV